MAKKSDSNGAGCIQALFALAVVGYFCVAGVRTCDNPYRRAERVRDTDPCAAAELFAQEAKSGGKGWSSRAVYELCNLPGVCALRELIGLMDLPNGPHVGRYAREALWQSVQRRTAGATPPPPRYYDPDGSAETRAREKAEWEAWFASAYPAASGPSTRSTVVTPGTENK